MLILGRISKAVKSFPVVLWLFFLLLILLPIQTRLIYFSENSQKEGSFIFYNTAFWYLTDLVLIVIILIWLVRSASKGLFLVKHRIFSRFTLPLWSFFTFSLISILVSREAITELSLFGLFKLFIIILFFCFTINIFSVKPVKQLFHIIFWLILATSIFQGIIGVSQYFSQHSLGLKVLGEEFIRPYLPGIAKFKVEEGQRWLFDKIFSVYRETSLVRPYGTFPHPNVFGGFFFLSTILSYYLFLVSHETWKRRLVSVVIFLQIFALFMSFSRLAVVAWLFSSIFWFSLVFMPRLNGFWEGLLRGRAKFIDRFVHAQSFYSISGFFTITRRLALMVAVFIIICGVLFAFQIFQRTGELALAPKVSETISDRLLYQKVAREMIKKAPMFGVGYQNFVLKMKVLSPLELKSYQYQPVHNLYLLILAEIGILGFVSFLLFLLMLMRYSIVRLFNLEVLTLFSILVGILFISFFDHYFFTIQQGRLIFFLVAGLLVALINQLQPFSSITGQSEKIK